MEAREARQHTWLGRSSVRSLRPGRYFDVTGLPIDPTAPKIEHRYTATIVTHVGINNLSSELTAPVDPYLTGSANRARLNSKRVIQEK